MRIKDVEGEHEEPVNLLSLIDTLFFLVMFFLVATQFKEDERQVGVQLPLLASEAPLSSAPRQLIVNVTEEGRAIVEGRAYSADELSSLLAQINREGGREVLIRADERSLHKYFAGVAALCRKAGINEVKIGYLIEEPK